MPNPLVKAGLDGMDFSSSLLHAIFINFYSACCSHYKKSIIFLYNKFLWYTHKIADGYDCYRVLKHGSKAHDNCKQVVG